MIAPNPTLRDRLYRPLTLLTIAIQGNYGGHPMPLRIGNLLLHAAVCLLVWRLAQAALGDDRTAMIAVFLLPYTPSRRAGRGDRRPAEILAAGFLVLNTVSCRSCHGTARRPRTRRTGGTRISSGRVLEGERESAIPFLRLR